jgi:putative flippase GtrA
LGVDSLAGHLVRYGISGVVVASLYIGATLLLSGPVGLPIALAIAIAIVLALTTHFILQRHFVFREEDFALSAGAQVRRYAVMGAVQWAVASLATSVLPDLLDLSEQVVYVAVTAVTSLVIFVVLRKRIFHPHEPG